MGKYSIFHRHSFAKVASAINSRSSANWLILIRSWCAYMRPEKSLCLLCSRRAVFLCAGLAFFAPMRTAYGQGCIVARSAVQPIGPRQTATEVPSSASCC